MVSPLQYLELLIFLNSRILFLYTDKSSELCIGISDSLSWAGDLWDAEDEICNM